MKASSIWRRLTSAERALLVWACAWAVLLLVGRELGVELESWKAQKLVVLLFWFTPFALLTLALNVRRSWWRWLAVSSTGLLMVIALLPATCTAVDVALFVPTYASDPSSTRCCASLTAAAISFSIAPTAAPRVRSDWC